MTDFKEKLLRYFEQKKTLIPLKVKELGESSLIEIQNQEGEQYFLNVDHESARLLAVSSEEVIYCYQQDPPQFGDCVTILENLIGKY